MEQLHFVDQRIFSCTVLCMYILKFEYNMMIDQAKLIECLLSRHAVTMEIVITMVTG